MFCIFIVTKCILIKLGLAESPSPITGFTPGGHTVDFAPITYNERAFEGKLFIASMNRRNVNSEENVFHCSYNHLAVVLRQKKYGPIYLHTNTGTKRQKAHKTSLKRQLVQVMPYLKLNSLPQAVSFSHQIMHVNPNFYVENGVHICQAKIQACVYRVANK